MNNINKILDVHWL